MALNDVQIKYTGDESDALKSIAKIEKQIDKLERRKIKFNTDTAQAKRFKSTIDDIDNKIGKLDGKKLSINTDTKQLSQAQTQLLRIEATQKRLQGQISKGASDSTILGSRATLSNQLKQLDRIKSIDISRPFTNAGNSLQSFSAGIDNLGSKLSRITVAITGMGTALAGVVATSGLNTLRQLENSAIGLETLLGSREEAIRIQNRIIEEAKATPFEIGDLSSLTQQLTAVTKNGDKSIDTLLDLGKAVVASGKGTSELNNVVANLVQVSATGKLTELDIRQFQRAIPVFNDVIEASGLTAEGLKDAENSGELLFKAFEKAGKEGFLANAFVNANTSFDLIKSNLQDTLNIVTSSAIKDSGIFQDMKDGMSVVIDFLNSNQDKITAFIKNVVDNIKKIDFVEVGKSAVKVLAVVKVLERLARALKPIITILGGGSFERGLGTLLGALVVGGPVLKGISLVTDKLGSLLLIVGKLASLGKLPSLAGLLGTGGIGGGIGSAFGGILSALVSLPALVAGVVLALSILGGGFTSLKENISGVLSGIGGFVSSIATIFTGITSGNTDQISKGIVEAFSNLGEIQGTIQQLLFDVIASAFKGAIKLFINTNPTAIFIRAIFDDNFREKLIETGKTALITAFNAIKEYIKGYITGLFGDETTGGAKNKLSEFIGGVVDFFTSIPGKISGAIEELKQKISDTWNNIKQTSSEFVTTVKEKVLTFFEELPYKIGFAVGAIVQWFKDLPTNILEALSTLSTTITTKFTEWWTWISVNVPIWFTNMVTWFTELPGKILGALATLVQTIKDKFQEWWSWLATNVPIWISNIVTWFTELPGKIATAIGNLADAFANWISGALNIGKTIADNIISGIGDIAGRVADAVGNVWDSITSGFGDAQGHAMGGVIYRADGGSIPRTVYASRGKAIQRFKPRGTDTVPAMLTPGEFVVKKSSVRRFGLDTMRQINNGNIEGTIKRLLQRPGAGVLGNKTSNTTSQTVNNSQNNSRSITAPITVNNYSQASERNSFFGLAGYISNGIG